MVTALVRAEKNGDVTVLHFAQENLDAVNPQDLEAQIIGATEEAASSKIIISFGNVKHLSSTALGLLISFNKYLKNKDAQLRLAEMPDNIYGIFDVTRLTNLFPIHRTVDEAINSFQ